MVGITHVLRRLTTDDPAGSGPSLQRKRRAGAVSRAPVSSASRSPRRARPVWWGRRQMRTLTSAAGAPSRRRAPSPRPRSASLALADRMLHPCPANGRAASCPAPRRAGSRTAGPRTWQADPQFARVPEEGASRWPSSAGARAVQERSRSGGFQREYPWRRGLGTIWRRRHNDRAGRPFASARHSCAGKRLSPQSRRDGVVGDHVAKGVRSRGRRLPVLFPIRPPDVSVCAELEYGRCPRRRPVRSNRS
jgi:hypothetical protein